MAVTLPDTRQLSDDVLEALRLRALRACERRFTQADVATILGVAPETVCRWWGATPRAAWKRFPMIAPGAHPVPERPCLTIRRPASKGTSTPPAPRTRG